MRNLSFISHPWVRTAAMVVSEIMDRLSPNMAPHTTAAMHSTMSKPVASLIDTAKGARADTVPTEVPMDTDTKQAMRNRPATANWLGRKSRNRNTVLSGGQEHQAHGQDILVGHPVGHHLQLGIEVQLAILEAGHRQGNQKDHDGRGLIEPLLDIQSILK